MDPVTILIGGTLFIMVLLFLLPANKKEREIARRVNKLHGPSRYPIFGTDLPLLFVKRMVSIDMYSLQRNPVHFPNPEKFDRDNFLPERAAKRHLYAYIPFSAGPRNRIGQNFAVLEKKTVFSYILRYYRLLSFDNRDHFNLLYELVLKPGGGVNLIITARETGNGNI